MQKSILTENCSPADTMPGGCYNRFRGFAFAKVI